MALAHVKLVMEDSGELPERVRVLLADADTKIEAFVEQHRNNPAAGFVPSNYEQVYRALAALHGGPRAAALLSGHAFCEWGSGLGVVTCLAALAGFDAVGIEIDARLVAASKTLAKDHRIAVELVHGSYVPDGHETEEDFDDSHVMTLEHGRAAYDELGLEPDDFDCIFAYPWPGEDDVVTSIFDRYAARGALLLTFHGQDGLLARRKVK